MTMQGTVTYNYDEEFGVDLFEFNLEGIIEFRWECSNLSFPKSFWKKWQKRLRDPAHKDDYMSVMHDATCKFNIMNLKLKIGTFGAAFADAIDKMLSSRE